MCIEALIVGRLNSALEQGLGRVHFAQPSRAEDMEGCEREPDLGMRVLWFTAGQCPCLCASGA